MMLPISFKKLNVAMKQLTVALDNSVDVVSHRRVGPMRKATIPTSSHQRSRGATPKASLHLSSLVNRRQVRLPRKRA